MKSLLRYSTALAVGLAACNGGNSTGPTVDSVTISPTNPTLDAVGATMQFSATALDASGKEITGVSVTWESSDTSVASISSSGVATAVDNGTTAITATVDGVAGSTGLDVSIASSNCDSPTAVSLAVGEYASYSSSNCLLIPSGQNGDRYRVTVLRTVGTGDERDPSSDTVTATLQVTGVGVSASPAAQVVAKAEPAALTGLESSVLLKSLQIQRATARAEAERLTRDAAMVEQLRRSGQLPVRAPSTLLRAAAQADLPATIQVDPATPSDCKTGAGNLVTGNLLYQNADLAIYQDSAQQDTLPVSSSDAQLMADYYTSYAKDMITSYFGPNPDIDGNGKLIIFVSPVVSGNEAAYVWSGDFYSKSMCPASNARDMIWFSASLIRSMDDATPSWQALPVVAHEAKHVVSLYNSIARGAFHPTWMEEGTAEISGEMSSRIAWAANGGPPVGARVTINDLAGSGGHIDVNKYDYGVLLRMVRTIYYLSSQPNGLVVSPDGASPDESVYGSGWHFHRWLGDGYGNASTPMGDAAFFHEQNDSLTPAGTAGLTYITGQDFSTLVDQFIAAVSLDGSSAPAPTHAFSTYDFVSATNILKAGYQPDGLYPWPVTTSNGVLTKSFASATYAGPIGAWGIRIHDFVSNGTGSGARIKVTMSGSGQIIVARLN
ncbi:MAG: Ig-like domain-containing protein [Gemmatimonadetes bacterium]|nr:Ig-like domain-containing protein [Gemmatimonadota bacterium]